MGTRKKKKQITVRLPIDLHEFIQKRAIRKHGKDYTAALIAILYKAQEIVLEEDAIIAQHWFQKWANERAKRIADHIKEEDEAGQQEENLDDAGEE